MLPIELLVGAPPPTEHILNVYKLKTRPEKVRYYHAAAGIPTQPTWIKTIQNGHYKSWPGLTAALAARHFPESNETWRGHGRKIKSNIRSTKKAIEEEVAEVKKILKEPGGQDKGAYLTCRVYHEVYTLQDDLDRKMYTDQTGRFPIRSYRGMQHVMVLIELESNSILVAGM